MILKPTVFLMTMGWASTALGAVLTGRVVDRLGQGVADATVVVQSTWATVQTSPRGNFSVEFPNGGSVVRVTAASGETLAIDLMEVPTGEWRVELPIYAGEAVMLDDFVVLPSRFPVGDLPGAQMSSLDAVLTPGSLADINRALQTLPGVDAQDEGDALYVRGGDANETGVFINGARYQQVRDEETPIGTFVGSVNPFLADSIRFEAGGFGAARGNLLSALVEVETIGAPERRVSSLNVGLGAVSGEFGVPLGQGAGVHLTATRRDVAPIFSANGSSRSFLRAPHGHDFSVLLAKKLAGEAELKFFGIEQTNTMAVQARGSGADGVYRADNVRRQTWLSGRKSVAGWNTRVDGSWARTKKTEGLGDWHWENKATDVQVLGRAEHQVSERARVAFGLESQTTRADMRESVTYWSGTDLVQSRRDAAWAEADFMVGPKWRTVAGWRLDHSNRGGGTTSDPRLATGYRVAPHLDLSFAWGVYHQRPDAVALSRLRGNGALSSERARHHIVALAWEDDAWQGRLELYRKEYDRLWLFDRDRRVRPGVGSAQGAELSGKFPLPWKWKGRTSFTLTDAERTDAPTGQMAPYGTAYSSAVVVQRSFDNGLQVGFTWRQAAGKRFTAVEGSSFDATSGRWIPEYGAPNGATLRSLQRLDMLVSRIQEVNTKMTLITYLSVSNLLGRSNQYDVAYSPDYRENSPVRSILNRIIYVGFTLQFR